MVYGYMVVIQDGASEHYSYGIPDTKDIQSIVYTSYDDAKAVIEQVSGNFESFIPVAYGVAFPYDTVTFDEEMDNKSFALLGWGNIPIEDIIIKIGIGLVRVRIN